MKELRLQAEGPTSETTYRMKNDINSGAPISPSQKLTGNKTATAYARIKRMTEEQDYSDCQKVLSCLEIFKAKDDTTNNH